MNAVPGSNIAAFRYLSGKGIQPSAVVEPFETAIKRKLRIHVLVTDVRDASRALSRAVELAIDLGAETRILVPQVVPYPLDLEYPAIPLEFTCKQMEILAGSVGADPYIYVFLCRDIIDLLRVALPERSIVVMSLPKRWQILTRAGRIGRALKRLGYSVVAV